ncbi:MAG: ATPase [Deltaproteobacteria bacterium]|nr:ATPase [Deltaproteobacteria bacterium]
MGILFAGIDAGSWAVKAVVLDEGGAIRGSHVGRTGSDFLAAAEDGLSAAIGQAGTARADVAFVMATGYGRKAIGFAASDMTEISAHAAGVHRDFPRAVTVVDVGGQDCKVIRLAADGRVDGFKMNRKCAAGTGAFLEESARRLGAGEELGRLSEMAGRSSAPVELGSFCTVFTQTEMLDLIRHGTRPDDLARGLFVSVVKRIQEMDALLGEIVLTGGVAEHQGALVEVMRERVAGPVSVAPHPQLTGALGAALSALTRCQS